MSFTGIDLLIIFLCFIAMLFSILVVMKFNKMCNENEKLYNENCNLRRKLVGYRNIVEMCKRHCTEVDKLRKYIADLRV